MVGWDWWILNRAHCHYRLISSKFNPPRMDHTRQHSCDRDWLKTVNPIQTTPMKKSILLTGLIAAFFGNFLSAQIVFTVQATADSDAYGYTLGSTYTFVFQTGSSYPEGSLPDSVFSEEGNFWTEEETSESQLFLSVTGTGVQGSFARPTINSYSPSSELSYYKEDGVEYLNLRVRSDDPPTTLTTLDNTPLYSISLEAVGFEFSSPGFAADVYTDPVSYLSAHTGSYPLLVPGSNKIFLRVDELGGGIYFTATSLTIAAVPEPATVALGLGVAALGLVLIRRRRT